MHGIIKYLSLSLLTMHLFFRPLGSADSAKNFSIIFLFRSLKLWTFLSQTPEPLQLKIFLVQLFFHIKLLLIATLLPFCCSSNKKEQKNKNKKKTRDDDPLPIAMSLCSSVNRLIRLSDVRVYEVLLYRYFIQTRASIFLS